MLTIYKFFQVRQSKKHRLIGHYPQVDGMIKSVSIDDPRYIGTRFFEDLPEDVVIPNGILHRRAKLTDLLSAMPLGFTFNLLVSQLTYELIDKKDNKGLRFYKTYVITPDERKHSYCMICPYRNCVDLLDFERCLFSIYSIDSSNGQSIDIKSSEEFQDILTSFKERQRTIRIDKVMLIENIDCDMFCLGNVADGGIGFYISEDLKSKFEKNGLTGFEYVLVN
jgi:hypothetical protein